MVGCCEDAIAVYEERKGIDRKGVIVQPTHPHLDFYVYYRSENWIHSEFNTPDQFPRYTGPASGAPVEYYGPGKYKTDREIMGWIAPKRSLFSQIIKYMKRMIR